ncbi:carboxymuconolactone decarboxylase family protein [Caldimonas tepidiphila]|uniref:carboxymuconolactone decarboxylase family protein n=1 Tax=Caldimonas tepidiphila TaxID=2315841 RepID=UPI000E5B390D|nr:carboxymuconolactone decarboxylase family protein [Caldimonas tepidiphila]
MNPDSPALPPDAYKQGLAIRRRTLGDAHVDRALANAGPLQAELQQLVTAYAWGSVWTRPGLSPRDRSLATVSMLVALGKTKELEGHVRGALNNGVTPEELKELLLHSTVYCGFPAAIDAFRTAVPVIEQHLQQAQNAA